MKGDRPSDGGAYQQHQLPDLPGLAGRRAPELGELIPVENFFSEYVEELTGFNGGASGPGGPAATLGQPPRFPAGGRLPPLQGLPHWPANGSAATGPSPQQFALDAQQMAQRLQAAMAGSAPQQQQQQSIASLLQLQGQLAAMGQPDGGLMAAAQQQQQLMHPATSARAVPTSAFEGVTGLSLGAINLSAGQAGDLLRAVGAGQPGTLKQLADLLAAGGGGGADSNSSLQWPSTGPQRQQAASAGAGGGFAAAPSVSKEDTTTTSGALVQHGNNLMLGNDSELPALSADGGMEGLHGGLAAFDSNRNMRRNPKQQMQNKQAQARYRERQKSKLVDMERTISELQAKVSAMQALETSYRNLEVNSRGMQAELAAKEQEIMVLRSSMQDCTSCAPSDMAAADLAGRLHCLSINGYLYARRGCAELPRVLDEIRDNLRSEQRLIAEANHVMLNRVLTGVQAGRFICEAYAAPERLDCLALANAMALTMQQGDGDGDPGLGSAAGGGNNTSRQASDAGCFPGDQAMLDGNDAQQHSSKRRRNEQAGQQQVASGSVDMAAAQPASGGGASSSSSMMPA